MKNLINTILNKAGYVPAKNIANLESQHRAELVRLNNALLKRDLELADISGQETEITCDIELLK
jgi:hypothetical protein